jgi:hypothetical protein
MTVKDDLYHLVDELDEDAAREALAYLQHLRLPRASREAPLDDELENEEERALSPRPKQRSRPTTWCEMKTSSASCVASEVDGHLVEARSARFTTARSPGPRTCTEGPLSVGQRPSRATSVAFKTPIHRNGDCGWETGEFGSASIAKLASCSCSACSRKGERTGTELSDALAEPSHG